MSPEIWAIVALGALERCWKACRDFLELQANPGDRFQSRVSTDRIGVSRQDLWVLSWCGVATVGSVETFCHVGSCLDNGHGAQTDKDGMFPSSCICLRTQDLAWSKTDADSCGILVMFCRFCHGPLLLCFVVGADAHHLLGNGLAVWAWGEGRACPKCKEGGVAVTATKN